MTAYVNFDTSHTKRVEFGITPPMQMAVTIPVEVTLNKKQAEVLIYICTSPFGQLRLTQEEFNIAVDAIVAQLEAREG